MDLARSYDRFKWRLEIWRIPEPFFDAPEEIKVALCQGKFDSDGQVKERAIEVTSINNTGLEEFSEIVESLGYRTRVRGPYESKGENRQDTYDLRVSNARSGLFRLPRKKKVLRKANSR